MLRVLTSLPYRFFSTSVQPKKGYMIHKLAYLIESPPKRQASSYALFVREESAGKKIKSLGDNSQLLKQKWQKSPQLKDKFKTIYQENSKDYTKIKEQYIQKFVTPFKRITYGNVLMKQLSVKVKKQIEKNGKQVSKSIEAYGKQFSRMIKQNPKEIQAAKKQAERIKNERQAIISKFKFPVLAYKTLRSYSLRHSLPMEQRGPTYKQDLRKGHDQHLKKWKAEVEEWLKTNQYLITIDEFINLYENALTTEKERKAELQESEDYAD